MGYAANIPNNNIESSYFDSLTLKKLWEITNTKQYLEKGPTSLKGNMSTLISTPLVNNFIASVAANLVADTTKSPIRSAHAETIMPSDACISIPQADKSTQKADYVAKLWNDYKVSPMAANIIWIICTDNKNNCYISIRLNEQPVKMPLKSKYPYFYAWNEFKTHIINRMLLLDSDS